MLKQHRPPPTLQGAPCFPEQKTWIRYRVEEGKIVGVWALNEDGAAVELPLTTLGHDFAGGRNERGEFTMTIPDRYVSPEIPG